MSNEAITAAWSADCTPTEKVVLVALADLSRDGKEAWPSIRRIVSMTGLSERGVRDQFRGLEQRGLITTQVAEGPNGCNKFTFHLPKLPRHQLPPPGTACRGHVVPPPGKSRHLPRHPVPPIPKEPSGTRIPGGTGFRGTDAKL